MFCEHCGTKKEENAQFCPNCGKKSNIDIDGIISEIDSNSTIENSNIFYSKEWHQKGVFAISSTPRLDVMADDQYLYLIKLPKYNNSTLGLFLGLIIGNIIGAYIGSSIGESSDEKKRQLYRSKWVDLNNRLISRDYEQSIFLKILLSNLKNKIIFKKSNFILEYGDNKKITLGRRVHSFRTPNKTEADRLNKYIQEYVL